MTGYFEPAVNLGDQINQGMLLGTISDPGGEKQETILAEKTGLVIVLKTFPRVLEGEALAVIMETDLELDSPMPQPAKPPRTSVFIPTLPQGAVRTSSNKILSINQPQPLPGTVMGPVRFGLESMQYMLTPNTALKVAIGKKKPSQKIQSVGRGCHLVAGLGMLLASTGNVKFQSILGTRVEQLSFAVRVHRLDHEN